MKIAIDAVSHKGLVRDGNEDALSIGGVIIRDDSLSLTVDVPADGTFYALVSDGMGGHEGGEQASLYTLEQLRTHLAGPAEAFAAAPGFPATDAPCGPCDADGPCEPRDDDDFEDALREKVRSISRELCEEAARQGQALPMGCTLTGVIVRHGRIWLVNAGDSRTYRFRDGILRQLTVDDNERGLTGDPTASKLLLNCIGAGCEGRLALEDITSKLVEGDTLLICSDGLCDMACDDSIEAELSAAGAGAQGAAEACGLSGAGLSAPAAAGAAGRGGASADAPSPAPCRAADLLRLACQGGGADNVSIILARIL